MPRAIAVLAMAAALAAVPAHDAAADEGRSVASHIQGAGETVRPVAVIEREDIAFSGMRTVSDLLLSRLICAARTTSLGLRSDDSHGAFERVPG